MENPDFLTIARMMAIYLHVLALAIAAVAVALATSPSSRGNAST
jgi:hypothetical protein